MNYADWPGFVQKKYWLTQFHIGDSEATDPRRTVPAENAIKWLYDVLTTLDTKASALMRLNGVLLAAAAFLLGVVGRTGTTILSTAPWDSRLMIICAFLSALSITLCLFVVNVSWPFLGKTTVEGNKCNPRDEIVSLDKACNFRRRLYQCAWAISLIASAGFLVEFGHQTWNVFVAT
jgi:hypothetical protein